MAFVYWIHLPEHTDMFTEGYIGFTSKTVEERYKGHLKESLEKRKETITRNPWLNARKNKCTWAEADKLFSIYQEHSGNFSSYYHFGQVCGKSETQVKNIFKLLKSGWVPHLDDNFTQWLTSYKANNGKK